MPLSPTRLSPVNTCKMYVRCSKRRRGLTLHWKNWQHEHIHDHRIIECAPCAGRLEGREVPYGKPYSLTGVAEKDIISTPLEETRACSSRRPCTSRPYSSQTCPHPPTSPRTHLPLLTTCRLATASHDAARATASASQIIHLVQLVDVWPKVIGWRTLSRSGG